jgi:hypothetical protein
MEAIIAKEYRQFERRPLELYMILFYTGFGKEQGEEKGRKEKNGEW